MRVVRGSVFLVALVLLAGWPSRPARADESSRFAPGAEGTQFMLYASLPLGGDVRAAPRFGLRLERMQLVPAVASAPFALHLRHRHLVDLQLGPGLAPRLEFGERYRLGYRQGAFALDDARARGAPP